MTSRKDLNLEALLNLEKGLNVYVLDEELRYVFFNQEHQRGMLSAFNAKIQLGLCKVDLLPEPLKTDYTKLYSRALESDSFKHVLKYDDDYLEFVFYPLSLGGKKHIMIKARDATEDIKVDQELERYREKLEQIVKDRTEEVSNQRDYFQRLIDEDPSLIFVRDEKGIFQLVNHSMAKALKKTIHEVIGSNISDVVLESDLVSKIYEEDLKVLKTGLPIDVIRESYMREESLRWHYVKKKRIEVEGKYFVMGVMSDISDLITTRNELQQANAELIHTIEDLKEMQIRLVTTEKIASILLLTSDFAHTKHLMKGICKGLRLPVISNYVSKSSMVS
jgi:PAS domain S-box-containing protein